MAALDMQTAVLGDQTSFENAFLQALLQSFLSQICRRTVLAIVQSSCFLKGSSSTCTDTCTMDCLCVEETRSSEINLSSIVLCSTRISLSSMDEENDSSEKCGVSIIDEVPAPEMADRVSREQFSEWLLVAKNKEDEDEDEDEDEEDEDDDEEDDDDDDEEEGGDEGEGGEDKGEEGDEDEDKDGEDEEDESDDAEEDEDDEDEDESPPKKLRK